MHIAFLTSSHFPKDDRIYFHQAKALEGKGAKVTIISSKEKRIKQKGNIFVDGFEDTNISKGTKINTFIQKLQTAKPDIIICSEPLAILAASRYNKKYQQEVKIIYDVTEWYPSKKNLVYLPFLHKAIVFFKLLIFNLITSSKADAFIFGEYYKAIPYRKIFGSKAFLFSTYYPDLTFLTPLQPKIKKDLLRLSYSGKLSREKGYANFLNVLKKLHQIRSTLKLEIKIIGWYADVEEEKYFEELLKDFPPSISITQYEGQSYEKYIRLIANTDIFIDLRSDDWENQRCLPIKLFYYAALQRPVIYSKLKAIEKEVEIEKFGHLVQPSDYQTITNIILQYLDNPETYYNACQQARTLAETKYNWDKIKADFVDFIYSIHENRR